MSAKTKRVILAGFLCILLILSTGVLVHAYTRILAFGDSLSDNGIYGQYSDAVNISTADTYGFGRISNGPVWVEYLAGSTLFNLPLLDLAYGGATTAYDNPAAGLSSTGLQWQVATYQSVFGTIAPTTLVTLWAGGNDMFNSRSPVLAATNIGLAIQNLINIGGREFIVPNLSYTDTDPYKPWKQPFDTNLALVLASLIGANPGVHIYELDMNGFVPTGIDFFTGTFLEQTYGPGIYAWYDSVGVHPTTEVHAQIADYAAAAVPELFSLTPYDDFSGTYIDKTKWTGGEWVREIDPANQRLLIKQTSPNPTVIGSYPYSNSNSLNFSDPNSVDSMQGNVTILDTNITNQATFYARLAGAWFNDGTPGGGRTGDIIGEINLWRDSTGVSAGWAIVKITNANGSAVSVLRGGRFSTPISLGTAYTLYISYDAAANQFTFKVGTEQNTFGPGGLPTRVGNPTDPGKGLGTRAEIDNSTSSGYVSAAFDNVYKNGVLYDDFSSPTIDSTQWTTYEFVREISGGTLWSGIRSSSGSTSAINNYLEFVDPSSINIFQAKVTPLIYQNNQGADILARIGGRYYNDGTPGGGYLGEVGAEVRIGGTGANPVAKWVVGTYTDFDGNNLKGVASGDFAKPISLNNTYTLLLGWDGSRFIFKFDDEVADYTPATSINPPNLPWKQIGTRVHNPNGKEAIIGASFDDVMVGGSCCPEIDVNPRSIDFGIVLPGKTSDQTVTIKNVGSVTLTLGTIGSPSAPFTITGGTCTNNQTLAPSGSCTLIIRLAPKASRIFTSGFSIPSDDPAEPIVTVSLRHEAPPDHFTLTISKSGAGNGTITSSPAGINCGDKCSAGFKPGAKVRLTAKPDSNSIFTGWSGGNYSGTGKCVVVMNADTGVTATFSEKTPAISVSLSPLDFGSVKAGKKVTKTLKIASKGTGDLTITISGIDGTDFSIKGSSSVTIKPKKSYNLNITFKPTSAGLKTTTLEIDSNDTDTPTLEISLTGTGQ